MDVIPNVNPPLQAAAAVVQTRSIAIYANQDIHTMKAFVKKIPAVIQVAFFAKKMDSVFHAKWVTSSNQIALAAWSHVDKNVLSVSTRIPASNALPANHPFQVNAFDLKSSYSKYWI